MIRILSLYNWSQSCHLQSDKGGVCLLKLRVSLAGSSRNHFNLWSRREETSLASIFLIKNLLVQKSLLITYEQFNDGLPFLFLNSFQHYWTTANVDSLFLIWSGCTFRCKLKVVWWLVPYAFLWEIVFDQIVEFLRMWPSSLMVIEESKVNLL